MKSLHHFLQDNKTYLNTNFEGVLHIMDSIQKASIIISKKVRKAGLLNITGEAGATNVQGESQKKLDIIANDIFIEALTTSGYCCGIASEENDDILIIDSKNGQYLVCMDPLDGSSNIDVNVSIGTIFSIYKKLDENTPVTVDDFLQKGNKQLAAGYVLYGSSTMMVFTSGNGVNGFTYDSDKNDFYLSNPNMNSPKNGTIYSLNQGNFIEFPIGVQNYIHYCQEKDKESNRPYSLRYIGSLVADFHRNLQKGGIFIYPPTAKTPNGKLRLLYECNPMAFIAEQSGGKAFTHNQRILDIKPTEIHQRVSLFIGSSEMVNKALDFVKEY